MKNKRLAKIIFTPILLLAIGAVIYFGLFADGESLIKLPEGTIAKIDDLGPSNNTSNYSNNLDNLSNDTSDKDKSTSKDTLTTTSKSDKKTTHNQSFKNNTAPPKKKTTNRQPPAIENPKNYTQNSNLYDELAVISKYTAPDLKISYSPNAASLCKSDMAAGCYLVQKNRIYINNAMKTDKSTRRVILAHEYMHYIWWHSDVNTSESREILTQKYKHSKELQTIIDDGYIINGKVQPTEILSYGCTTLNRKQMGEDIYKICNKYLNLNTISPFVNMNPDRLVGAINYMRQKNNLSGLYYTNELNSAAKFGLNAILSNASMSDLSKNRGILDGIRATCGFNPYRINYMYSNNSGEVYIAKKLINSGSKYLMSDNITSIGVAVKKEPYIKSGSNNILKNVEDLINVNIIVQIAC